MNIMKTLGHQKACATVVGLALLVACAFPGGSAWAISGGDQYETTGSGAGLGAAGWLLSIPYGAGKVAFAALGGIIGGFTYALTGGDLDTAKKVWTTSIYGTYVITPDHLNGERPLRFFGHTGENVSSEPAQAPTP